MKKGIDLFLALVFVLFAALQWNDPDPWAWILLYLAVASIPMIHLLDKSIPYFTHALLLLLIVIFATYIPSLWRWLQDGMPSITTAMKADSPYVELVREALGILLCIALVGGYAWGAHRTRHERSHLP